LSYAGRFLPCGSAACQPPETTASHRYISVELAHLAKLPARCVASTNLRRIWHSRIEVACEGSPKERWSSADEARACSGYATLTPAQLSCLVAQHARGASRARLWIGNEHTGKNRSGGDARPVAGPMQRACMLPQPATAARRWFQAARSVLGWLQPSCSCSCAPRGGPPSAVRARGSGQIPWDPPAARGPWRSWILAAGPPSAVTEVGCQWPSRWRRLATARGRFPEMQKWAQVAEESGSRVWARPREACDLMPSQWRTRDTGPTPHLASRNKRASPGSKVSRRWGYHHSPAGRHKSADEGPC
jgi:hypothetical protein